MVHRSRATYQVKSNTLIVRVNCERSVRCTRQTWDHSSQAARSGLTGFMKTDQTDRFPENSCPLAMRFAPLSRLLGELKSGEEILLSLVCPLPFMDFKNRDLFKVYMGHRRLALPLAGWQGIFTDFGLESVEKRSKETHFISIFSPYFNCYYLHPVLIYSELFWRLSA